MQGRLRITSECQGARCSAKTMGVVAAELSTGFSLRISPVRGSTQVEEEGLDPRLERFPARAEPFDLAFGLLEILT
jgi:hypothetical protein